MQNQRDAPEALTRNTVHFVRPTNAVSLRKMLSAAKAAEPTYIERGASLTGNLPAGYQHLQKGVVLGQGDNVFAISITENGIVDFNIKAFSRPNDPITRITGPFSKRMQSVIATTYLRSLKRFVEQSSPAN